MCISMTYLQLNVLALKLERYLRHFYVVSWVTSLTFCLHFQDNGVNLLSIRAVEPDKYALSLMDVLFTEAEMASCCYDNKKSSKPGLPPTKVQLLEGMCWNWICFGVHNAYSWSILIIAECVARKFGRSVMEQSSLVIRKKCNQKCIDRANKSKQAQKPQKTQKLQ